MLAILFVEKQGVLSAAFINLASELIFVVLDGMSVRFTFLRFDLAVSNWVYFAIKSETSG